MLPLETTRHIHCIKSLSSATNTMKELQSAPYNNQLSKMKRRGKTGSLNRY
uniref:Uncharacterized protein n=2 Tax=Anguilla anguilla TaxID=7936 RepID=A0A0E9UWM0_ANGAN